MTANTSSANAKREVELAEALLKQREQDSDRYSGRKTILRFPPVATVAPSSSVTGTPSP
ncbi:hypothetical protein N5T54_21020 [Escherichia coli]|nr:hypothetical protein [Escherichia coli]MCW3248147.1 hypothetical protein [Escherichia coli]